MPRRIEAGIIGLGKFGYSLAEALKELGHDVIGVDQNMDRVQRAQAVLDQVYQADGTDKAVLRQLGIHELDHVVVSIGNDMGPSTLIAMNLLELEVDDIWVKAVSEAHQRVLERLGVHYVVFPEQFVARQLAHRLAVPGLLDYLPLGSGVMVSEAVVDQWTGMTIQELALPSKHNVQIVAVKEAASKEFSFVPKADTKLATGDTLVLLGQAGDIGQIKS